ncbi:hypothetical protein CHS0354_002929 [Potamilus streckersoni]|uniref:RING-type domain-containing protein n=1 Tax=Potamilus streckersoni TaxID=2493646 RepID=A0AAE0W4E5_9BIVA|nr:hypothetical protein CHS0354_002929 [Potamilus streckersoni]
MAIVFYRRHSCVLKKNEQWKHVSECSFCKTDRIASYVARTQPLDAEIKVEGVEEGQEQSTEEHVLLPQKKFTKNTTPPQVLEITIPQLEEEDMENYITKQLLDNEHEIEEATTKHQSSTNAEATQEVQELRDDAICKICFSGKKSMMFMPCNHLATCVSCGIALQQCPVCRALIEEKIIIRF